MWTSVPRGVKEELDATEALYIAFPFALQPEQVQCDISGGVFTPGSEQIPALQPIGITCSTGCNSPAMA